MILTTMMLQKICRQTMMKLSTSPYSCQKSLHSLDFVTELSKKIQRVAFFVPQCRHITSTHNCTPSIRNT